MTWTACRSAYPTWGVLGFRFRKTLNKSSPRSSQVSLSCRLFVPSLVPRPLSHLCVFISSCLQMVRCPLPSAILSQPALPSPLPLIMTTGPHEHTLTVLWFSVVMYPVHYLAVPCLHRSPAFCSLSHETHVAPTPTSACSVVVSLSETCTSTHSPPPIGFIFRTPSQPTNQ